MTQKGKVEPAHLTDRQKADIKKQILQQFPSVAMFQDEIDFLIDEYSKDKNYVAKLMKQNSNAIASVIDKSKLQTVKTVKADTDEWKEIVERMEKSKEEFTKIEDDEKSIVSI